MNGVAFNCVVAFTGMSALPGETETVTAKTVTKEEAVLEVSATEVAVMNTSKSLAGGVEDAVYVTAAPLRLEVGETLPQGAVGQDTDQVTPWWDGSLVTVAVIDDLPPICTVGG